MERYKGLLKNIGLLTVSSFASKVLTFILVPLYTNILSIEDYGTYDLFNTSVALLIPILTLDIQEAVMRFALDKKFNNRAVLSVGLRYLLSGSLIVAFGLGINHIFNFYGLINEYAVFFFGMYFTQALTGITIAYIRGTNRIADLAFSGLAGTGIILVCNILFLAVFKWGLIGYFLANIIGPLLQCLYLMIRANVLLDAKVQEDYSDEKKEMISYSKPLILNNVAWWINNASDRYIIILFWGIGDNGIYSVASKIPSILNIFQTTFSQAWTISAVQDFDSEDKDSFFSNTYAGYNCLMVVLCSVIILSDKVLARLMYAKDFYEAWRFVPWLTIAIVFGALSGYIGGIFSAIRNTRIFAQSTIIGAAINVGLNIILIPTAGSLGAAVATTICYVVTWVFRYIHVKKFLKLRIRLGRDIIAYIILVIQAVILILAEDAFFLYISEIGLLLGILLLYREDLYGLLRRFNKR